jgi:hypothetical protein
MFGSTQMVDMVTTWKNDFGRILVAVLDPTFTIRNIHFYNENVNNESETVIKNAFYDENFGFVIDHRDEPRTPLSMTKLSIVTKKHHRTA